LKKTRRQVDGPFVEVNCATLRGDSAMSTLFGHVKGAFTGAIEARPGLLRKSDGGLLFLDEIGELGADEQAMLLRAIEEKSFYPVGSDKELRSDFQLLAGTNRDLSNEVIEGRFREDLLARINLWTFRLPSLRERPEDVEPNLEYELEVCSRALKRRVSFSKEARTNFLAFATSAQALWPGNFRDFNAAVRRLATLSQGGRVSASDVEEEIERLLQGWSGRPKAPGGKGMIERHLGPDAIARLDPFDHVQLEEVLNVCNRARSLSEAGRRLFAVSRTEKKVANDADRLRKYLARFGIDWKDLVQNNMSRRDTG
ncbi:MAG: sigma 54-interacting transcriptional regulator, partial [Myxococcaceae bacterium]